MSEPNSENISRVIWGWMDEKNCWHNYLEGSVEYSCLKCNLRSQKPFTPDANPDLTDDRNLHLVRLAELKAVEVFGLDCYVSALDNILCTHGLAVKLTKDFPNKENYQQAWYAVYAIASAAQRATAIYNLKMESDNA